MTDETNKTAIDQLIADQAAKRAAQETRRRWTVGIAQEIKIGTATAFEMGVALKKEFEKEGIKSLRPQRFTSNVSGPGLVYLKAVRVGAREVVLCEEIDAWMWNPNAVGQHLDVDDVGPEDSIQVKGRYTGEEMFGLSAVPYLFTLALTGPIVLVGD